METHPPEPGGFLARRYLATLALVAMLVLLDQAVIQPPLHELTVDAPVINIAGRQRMLSQRLAKAALALVNSADPAGRRRFAGEMEMVLARWSAAHDGLRFGDPTLALPGRNSRAVASALEAIDPTFQRLREAARALLRGDSADSLVTLLRLEGDYLEQMDRIVGLYEAEARDRVESLRRTGWAVTGLVLLALVGIGQFVLRPAVGLIRRQFAEVRDARDALEARVLERTAELEQANAGLRRESRERALAEARHRALLEQFSHVTRTTTLGEMAAGLAHELNQPLGAVANYVEGCLVALENPDPPVGPVRDALNKALGSTLRAGEILRRIRTFVARHPAEPEWFLANRVVEEVAALLRDEANRLGIDLRLELAPELPWLLGDPVQVQQVLVNLVRNATEAVAAAQTPVPAIVLATELAPDGAVEFRVLDNGEGISSDRIDRVFDPFFSTRAEGLGMGLAISRTIVEAHQGRLSVESTPRLGTTFRFSIPPHGGPDDGTDHTRGG